MKNEKNLTRSIQETKQEALAAGLRSLYGHDCEVAQRELEWVEANLDADPDMPLIAHYLREIVSTVTRQLGE